MEPGNGAAEGGGLGTLYEQISTDNEPNKNHNQFYLENPLSKLATNRIHFEFRTT